jgi:hypothetical protein
VEVMPARCAFFSACLVGLGLSFVCTVLASSGIPHEGRMYLSRQSLFWLKQQ